jgi:hypothetical protein
MVQDVSLLNKLPTFMEAKGLLSALHRVTTVPYSESVELS